ncbi:MAG: allophanate hydrolase [Blastochloris sp.]|nr:allophanate hydrolase [Blastochloris sp.]
MSSFSGGGLEAVARQRLARMESEQNNPIWIRACSENEVLQQVRWLEERRQAGWDDERLPLYGQFFAVKDNIDVEGVPTTAGCPDYAYLPKEDAPVVRELKEAGAIFLGKTHMDQFATGLVGTRSPLGPCRNAFNPEYIAGGSSSGSAVAVASGMADFSLGTDTAGSGRIPAAFQGLVGYKPSKGLLSTRGVVPACRSLDCVSLFAKSVQAAESLASICAKFDPLDPYARGREGMPSGLSKKFRFGVPEELEFFGDQEARALFEKACLEMEALGAERVVVDDRSFREAARLLYQGPWVAERSVAVGEWMREHPGSCDPVVASIIAGGQDWKAVDVYRAMHRLEALKREAARQWERMDLLFLPTAPTVYTLAQIAQDPFGLNTRLGTHTNFRQSDGSLCPGTARRVLGLRGAFWSDGDGTSFSGFAIV